MFPLSCQSERPHSCQNTATLWPPGSTGDSIYASISQLVICSCLQLVCYTEQVEKKFTNVC